MTLPSTNLLCDALHRASPDPERPRHLQDAHALRKLPSHLPLGRAVDLRSAELHALSDGALETCFDPLADDRPLKLSKGAGFPASVRPCSLARTTQRASCLAGFS